MIALLWSLSAPATISDVGVAPDIFIEEQGQNFKTDSPSDNQLNYALKLLTLWSL